MNSRSSLGALRGLQKCSRQDFRVGSSSRSVPCVQEGVDIQTIIDNKLTNVVPRKFNFARDVIDHWARKEALLHRNPHHPALQVLAHGDTPERCFNYTEVSQLTKQLAGVFVNELGLTRQDRILISLPRCPEFWLSILAALRAGIEFTTVTTQSVANDFKYRLEQFQPSLIISNNVHEVDQAVNSAKWSVLHRMHAGTSTRHAGWLSLTSRMSSCREPVEAVDTDADDPAVVFFTSGTTGSPKMVQHNAAYPLAHMSGDTNLYQLKTSDWFMCTADTGWAKTAFGTYPIFTAGASLVIDPSGRFCPRRLLDFVEKYPITKLSSAPTVFRLILKENLLPRRFKALEAVFSGGEPLSGEAFNQWKKLTGLEIREGYGQSETMMVCTGHPNYPPKPGSMGVPAPEYEIAVINDEGQIAGDHEVGQFAIKIKPDHPFGLFTGYKNNPEKTAEVFSGDYYLTGDRVYRDEDNYYWFVSRSDDVITSAGYRIGPFEIETVLAQHPAVLESSVIGVPDKERVEVVKAFIILREEFRSKAGPDLMKDIQDFAKKLTAPYKYPRKIEFTTELPKTISGKVQKHVLRAREKAKKE